LASCGVYARGKFSGNLKVCRPSELLRSPARTPSRQPIANTIKAQESDSLSFQNSLWEYDNRNEDKFIHVIEQFYFADDGRFYYVKLVSASGYYKHFYSGRYEYNVADNTILLYAENAYNCSYSLKAISAENFHRNLIREKGKGKKILLKANPLNHLVRYPDSEYEQQDGESFFVMEANPEIFEVDFIKIDDFKVSKEDQKTILNILRRAKPITGPYIDPRGYRKEYATISIKNKNNPDFWGTRQILIFTGEPQPFIWHENSFNELINIIDKYIKE